MHSATDLSAEALTRTLASYLAEHEAVTVIEEGAPLFDLNQSHYSVSDSHGKSLLHVWSDERNIVRRVLAAQPRQGALVLTVQKFGRTAPVELEFCPSGDSRTATAKKAARVRYAQLLRRVLATQNPAARLESLATGMDLEHTFSPVYARGLLRHGNSGFAVLGVNNTEMQASIDAALGFGILWLEACRAHREFLVEGLRLFVPPGSSAVLRQRMAHLHRGLAKWELYELDERTEQVAPIDTTDAGNIATRLVHAPDRHSAFQRFAHSVAQVLEFVPEAEPVVVTPTEVAFRLHGLQFAGARLDAPRGQLRMDEQLYFGVRSAEFAVTPENRDNFHDYLRHIRDRRIARNHSDPIHRAVPERWIESLIVKDVSLLDSRFDGQHVYSQVPAFAACDRAMIDVLTATRDGRLAVVELKADEDIHLPLQGLDYWARVKWHHERGEFQKFGYFAGRELASADPLLFLVAPALRVHPTTDTILKYISPQIEWTLLAIDERWRDGVRVIFRKHPTSRT